MCEGKTGNRNERNIMILFLSNLHYKRLENPDDKRKVLDDGHDYEIYPPGTTKNCIETNEAPLSDVLAYVKTDKRVDHPYLDAVFYFVTNKVKNCKADGTQEPPIEIFESENDIEAKWRPVSEEEFFWTERAEKITGLSFKKVVSVTDIFPVEQGTVWRIPISFNDSEKDPVKSSISAVRAMENTIKAYLAHEEVPMEKCNIYADTTGGFRPANMAMSAVMQLLVYQHAKLQYVVYSELTSKKVSDVQAINDMYQLVEGVGAFTKYGSSAAISEYFDGVEYAELQNLLMAMNDFSESVLLCQPNDIEKNLKALMNALEAFPKEPKEGEERPPKVELFARMVDDLIKKYTPMYPKTESGERKTDRLEIIRWCVDNTLLQQAITFCTEWLPDYLIERGVVYTDDEAIQRYCESSEFPSYRSGKKNFLMQFCTKHPNMEDIFKKPINDTINHLMEQKISAEKAKAVLPQEYENVVDDMTTFLHNIPIDLPMIQAGQSTNNERLDGLVDRIVHSKNKNTKIPLEKITPKDIVKRLSDPTTMRMVFSFPAKTAMPYDDYDRRPLFGASKDKTARVCRSMLKCGLMKTALPDRNKAIYYVQEYTYIRDELRNKVNHAHEVDEKEKESDIPITILFVKNKLSKYLTHLDQLKSMKKMKFTGLWAEDMKEETQT